MSRLRLGQLPTTGLGRERQFCLVQDGIGGLARRGLVTSGRSSRFVVAFQVHCRERLVMERQAMVSHCGSPSGSRGATRPDVVGNLCHVGQRLSCHGMQRRGEPGQAAEVMSTHVESRLGFSRQSGSGMPRPSNEGMSPLSRRSGATYVTASRSCVLVAKSGSRGQSEQAGVGQGGSFPWPSHHRWSCSDAEWLHKTRYGSYGMSGCGMRR